MGRKFWVESSSSSKPLGVGRDRVRGAVVEMPDCPHSLDCSFSAHSPNHLGPEGWSHPALHFLIVTMVSLNISGADTTLHPLFPPFSHPSSWAVQPLRVLPVPASPELRHSEPMIHKVMEKCTTHQAMASSKWHWVVRFLSN